MYLLHLSYPSGTVMTVTCHSALSRELLVIAMIAQSVTVRLEDRQAVAA